MPKTRLQKEAILTKTQERLSSASSVVLVNISGVKVGEIESIRDALFPQGLNLQVAKNNLMKIALKEVGIEVPAEILDQPLGLVFAYDDPVASAKASMPFAKEVAAFEIVGGIVDGQFVSASQVEALAALPGREQLLGQLVGTIAAPLSGFVNVLAGNIRGLVNVLSAVRDAKGA